MGPIEGRWVCHRCYASNDAIATACVRCGLERGADPTTAAAGSTDPGAPDQNAANQSPADPQQPQWTPPPPAPARPMWMQLGLRFWWVGLIIVVAAGGWYFSARRDDSGQITTAGDLKIGDLRVGDCFNLKDPEADEIEQVDAKPCTQAHQYEMYFVGDMPRGEYPSDDEFAQWIEQNCGLAFESYVGIGFQESVLQVLPVTPTEGLWHDDRSVQCALLDPADEQLTSTLKSSAR
jgi:hypothetical protein